MMNYELKKHLYEKTLHVESQGVYIIYTSCGMRIRTATNYVPRYLVEDTKDVTCGGCKRSIKYKEAEDDWYVVEREIKKQLG